VAVCHSTYSGRRDGCQLCGKTGLGLGANSGFEEVDALSMEKTLVTSRLEVRPPRELDRARFVELFCNDDFMRVRNVWNGGTG
jgi:hypothetical protein